MPKLVSLKDIIHQVRAARTAADERALVYKECALIRVSFRNEDNTWRWRNVTKLLYIYILGYQAHFGQLECLKLIASSKFTDKRIGYTGSMLLLDERQDVHLLMTNSLRNDLNSQIQFVVGFALCTLGVICSPEMSRDLAGEVVRLLRTSNAYVRKKAALCAFRMVKKVPELMEMFIPATRSLISEKDHGVIIATVVLITEICEKSPDVLNHFKKLSLNIVHILKNLIVTAYSPEYDVCGVSDPFLQVKILKLLRLLGKNDSDVSEKINDTLAHVATNTGTNKNAGNAILYETVLSILGIKSESGLRRLGVNILGQLLLNTDRNIKYVALNTLIITVQTDYHAIQLHRFAIVKCLKEHDGLIRKRALELCFALVNSNNIRSMTHEILSFWEDDDPEFNAQCSSYIFISTELYSPSTRWHIDTMVKVLTLSRNYIIDDVVGNLIKRISATSILHAYTVQQLWKQLTGDLTTKQPLVQVSCWCIGEFGDLLNHSDGQDAYPLNVSPDDIINLVEKVIVDNHMTIITKEYSVTALMKLSVRFPNFALRIMRFLDNFRTNINTELQQRAIEFFSLFQKFNHLRSSILERMPAIEKQSSGYTNVQNDENSDQLNDILKDIENNKNMEDSRTLDIFCTEEHNFESETVGREVKPSSDEAALLQFLDDTEFESQIESTYTSTPHSVLLAQYITFEPYLENIPPITAFDKNSLKIIFEFDISPDYPQMIIINLVATNYSVSPMHDFLFKAAVPKGFQLQILPPTSNVLPANNLGKIQQTLKILNPNKIQLRMKIRVSYVSNGQAFSEDAEVNNVPKIVFMYLN